MYLNIYKTATNPQILPHTNGFDGELGDGDTGGQEGRQEVVGQFGGEVGPCEPGYELQDKRKTFQTRAKFCVLWSGTHYSEPKETSGCLSCGPHSTLNVEHFRCLEK